tara:strand:- start:1155 stop:1847 length:693 start_codon:yes stop_codon:yes gene_type:complete
VIGGKKILAVILARGGSKGIKLKNLRKINNKSLVFHAANIVKKINEIDRAIVSTDHNKISKEAVKFGLSAPFKRPTKLSGDKVSDYKVLDHALRFMEKFDKTKYDIIVSLPPTSPLRKSKDVRGAIKMMIKNKFDSVWTVSPTDSKYHPLKQLNLVKNKINYFDKKGSRVIARQQLKLVYHRNGVAYVATRECILKKKNLISKNSGGYVTKGYQVSIDTVNDLKQANKKY